MKTVRGSLAVMAAGLFIAVAMWATDGMENAAWLGLVIAAVGFVSWQVRARWPADRVKAQRGRSRDL